MTYVFGMKWFEIIRQRREELGLSQAQLAVKAKVSQAAINKIEAGRVYRSRFIPRIASALGIPASSIDSEIEAEFPQKSGPIVDIGPHLLTEASPIDPEGELQLAQLHESTDGTCSLTFGALKTRRPNITLPTDVDLAAFLYSGQMMRPEFEAGDVIYAATLPLRAGLSYVLFSKQRHLMGGRSAVVARIAAVNEDNLVIRRWHPSARVEREEVVSREAWPVSLRIVAKDFGRYGFRELSPEEREALFA